MNQMTSDIIIEAESSNRFEMNHVRNNILLNEDHIENQFLVPLQR